jgi:hypothetical protein
VDIASDESSGDDQWLLRHLSSAVGLFDVVGSVIFWMLAETEGLEVSLALDDPGRSDRGKRFDVIADGDWYKYEWFIEDEALWDHWLTNSNGAIDGLQVSLDSIFWDSQVIIPEPTTLAIFAGLGGWGLTRRQRAA